MGAGRAAVMNRVFVNETGSTKKKPSLLIGSVFIRDKKLNTHEYNCVFLIETRRWLKKLSANFPRGIRDTNICKHVRLQLELSFSGNDSKRYAN